MELGLVSALEPLSCSDAERAWDFIVGVRALQRLLWFLLSDVDQLWPSGVDLRLRRRRGAHRL